MLVFLVPTVKQYLIPDQGLSPPIAQFSWAASSRKSLGGSKLLPFKDDGGHCVLGDLGCLPFQIMSNQLNLS
jgi:hypothetical protein